MWRSYGNLCVLMDVSRRLPPGLRAQWQNCSFSVESCVHQVMAVWLFGPQILHDRGDRSRIRDADVRIDDVTLTVKDEQRWRGADLVHLRYRQAGGCCHVDPDQLGAAQQLLGKPVHDRLGHQACRSAIGEEIYDGRLSRLHLPLKIGSGPERRARAAQREPSQRQADDDEQAHPVVA